MTESTVYRESLETELMENNADLVDMLVGAVELDPIFLLNALSVVGLVDDSKDEEIMRVRNATVEVAKTVGRRVVREAMEQWSFCNLMFEPDMDKVEQNMVLQSLVEDCGLFRFIESAETKEEFQAHLLANRVVVQSSPEKYDGLDMTSIFINDALPTSSGHIAKKFLKDMAKAAKPTWLSDLRKFAV